MFSKSEIPRDKFQLHRILTLFSAKTDSYWIITMLMLRKYINNGVDLTTLTWHRNEENIKNRSLKTTTIELNS